MKAFLAGLLLAASPVASAPPAQPASPEITGVVVIVLDDKPTVLEFIYSNGAAPLVVAVKDCNESEACMKEVIHLGEIRHVGHIALHSATQV